ncbi:preprotein translocase subunit SecE [Gordonibacter sp. An230]|uniref:preprotein translocase subunit SecE n=1 Tax=Gordonibacter sp. An230 TaxID=1965592 RepID=UPI000B3ADACB|nr:preprotein translocase subunit SecE [Gordonibacter sp. An230]OUO90046.1 preprotein translocase subunit SecE [Gordonibacter sp. An230]
MAKKSKTQRAKASAARAARKERARQEEAAAAEAKQVAEDGAAATETPKRKFFKKAEKPEASASDGKQANAPKGVEKKAEKTPAKKSKKHRLGFLKDVRAELKRVTWPTKQDVLRWSVVVVVALLFFGVYVAALDNVVIAPILVAISGLAG